MFKFLHAADIHLDSPLQKLDKYDGAPVQEIRLAGRRAFENLVRLAIAEEVSFVLIAGDLYDGDWKDYNTGLYLVSQVSRLREAGIAVYIAAGNHDAASRITKALRLPENVRVFPSGKPATFRMEGPGVAVHGQSFGTPAVRKDLSLDYPDPLPGLFNVGVLHTCATGREGHEPYAPCTVEGLRGKGYDYWALGHVHQFEVLHDDPPILFSGNIQGRHIRETGPKGCVLVSVEDDGTTAWGFRELDVIRWAIMELDAAGSNSPHEVVERFRESLAHLLEDNEALPLVVRVMVRGETGAHGEMTADAERWTNEIRAAAVDTTGGRVWIEKVKIGTSPPSEGVVPPPEGAIGELLRLIDELTSGQGELSPLTAELKDLEKKLPRELKKGARVAEMDDPDWITGLLRQLRPMLVRRLMGRGETR